MFKIKTHIYPNTVYVFFADNMDLAVEEHNKYHSTTLRDSHSKYEAVTIYHNEYSKDPVGISVCLQDDPDYLIASIHHEAIHIAWYILHYNGVVVTQDNDEALTYLSTYIFKSICKKLKLI